jgi:hypothetical protein
MDARGMWLRDFGLLLNFFAKENEFWQKSMNFRQKSTHVIKEQHFFDIDINLFGIIGRINE